jgi:putative transposase
MRMIQTTYRYRLMPTPEQESLLKQFAGSRRFIWNWALARKQQHYRATGKTLSFTSLCKQLTLLKQRPETAWLREIDSQSLQQALRDLESAFQHFFRRVRQGEKRKGFPKFKAKKTDTPRFRMPQRVSVGEQTISAPKIGRIAAIIHRPLEGVAKSATFKCEPCGHWYVTLVAKQVRAERTERGVDTQIGIDLGLKSLAVLSTGETIANPRYYRTQTRKLAKAQRALCRKQKATATQPESHNRAKARAQVARLHYKVKNQRKDILHKLSCDLVRRFDLIAIEDLHVRGLAKSKLATSVLDAGWGMLRSFLTYKADRQNKHLIVIGRFYPSSRLCPRCGAVNHDLSLADRTWMCSCGVVHDRDLNAARNIAAEGKRLFERNVAVGSTETQNACRELVRPIEMVGATR